MGADPGAGRDRSFVLACGLYTASTIIGAGVLGLPALTATVGLLPAVGMTLALGLALIAVYARIAASTHEAVRAQIDAELATAIARAGIPAHRHPEASRSLGPYLVGRKGAGTIDAVCAWLGLGRSGRAALAIGLGVYIIPATALYIGSGGLALAAIAGQMRRSDVPPAVIGSMAVALIAMSGCDGLRRAELRLAAQMAGCWLATIAMLTLVPRWQVLPALLFAATVAGLVIRAARDGSGAIHAGPNEPRRQLEPAHRVGAIMAVVLLLLLTLTGGLAIGTLASHGDLARPTWVASDLDSRRIAKALGGLLFAYTGTAVFNLLRYPALFEPGPGGRRSRLGIVVVIGTAIPTIAYAGWMVMIALTLPPSVLLETDNARGYATVPLAARLTEHGAAGWLVFVAGYAVALLAVTGAGLGFSESLGDRLARIHRRRALRRSGRAGDTSDAPEPWRARGWQIGVLGLGTALAVLLELRGDAFAFRDILAVAGYAGGGLLLLVLPFFIPAGGQGRSPKRDLATVTIVAACLAILNLHDLPGGAVANGVVIALTAGFVASFLWLLASSTNAMSPPLKSGSWHSRRDPRAVSHRPR